MHGSGFRVLAFGEPRNDEKILGIGSPSRGAIFGWRPSCGVFGMPAHAKRGGWFSSRPGARRPRDGARGRSAETRTVRKLDGPLRDRRALRRSNSRRFSRGSRRAFRSRSVLPGTRLRRALPGFGLSQSSGLSAERSWCRPDGSRSSPGAEATTLRPQAPPLPRSQGVPEGAPLMGRVMGIYAVIGRKSSGKEAGRLWLSLRAYSEASRTMQARVHHQNGLDPSRRPPSLKLRRASQDEG